MKLLIERLLEENYELATILKTKVSEIESIAQHIIECFNKGRKLLFLGNGGSAVDAMHMAAEYTSRFCKERKSLPAIDLPSSIAAMTSIANDWDYEYVFARQLESLAQSGDIVVSFSTSGESKNVIRAIAHCKSNSIKTISFTGFHDNTVARSSDIVFQVPSTVTARIQESYILVNHIICEIVDAQH